MHETNQNRVKLKNMSKPVIIFGAGASHDVVNRGEFGFSNQFQPPLTNDLFNQKWDGFIHTYKALPQLLPQIRQCIKDGINLEQFLRGFKEKIAKLGEDRGEWRNLQLIELEIYLRQLFMVIGDQYLKKTAELLGRKDIDLSNSNNYTTFLQELKDSDIEEASIITFNYDLFLDKAFEFIFGYTFNKIPSYYSNAFKFYKVHGSVDWFYPGVWNGIGEMPTNISVTISELLRTDQKLKDEIYIIGKTKYPPDIIQVPCLSIPLPQDKDFIVEEHRTNIIKDLEQTDKLVIVGWSASDEYFVELINKHIKDDQAELIIIDKISPDGTNGTGEIVNKLSNKSVKKNKKWKNVTTEQCGFSGLWSKVETLERIFS